MRATPLTGGYGCVDTGGFFSQCIRTMTHSQYSHAFIVLDATVGTILEAEPKGARISNLTEYVDHKITFSDDAVKATPDQIKKLSDRLVGTPYGFLDIAYLGIALTEGWTPSQRPPRGLNWLLDSVLDDKTMICSQMVAYFGACFKSNWNCGQPDDQLVTPGMLAVRKV